MGGRGSKNGRKRPPSTKCSDDLVVFVVVRSIELAAVFVVSPLSPRPHEAFPSSGRDFSGENSHPLLIFCRRRH
jgi:hypothetical protein